MSLTERYLQEISSYLPLELRKGVISELRSSVQDAAEDRKENGREACEIEADILRELGPPVQVAARYQPKPNYLIGPVNFMHFKKAAWILFVVLMVIHSFILITALSQADLTPRSALLLLSGTGHELIGNYLTLLGLIALVIGFLESVSKEPSTASWDPNSLPPLNESDGLNRTGWVFAFIGILSLLVLFNIFPQYFQIQTLVEGTWHKIALTSEGLRQNALLFNSWGILSLVFILTIIRKGAWHSGLRWADLLLHIMGIALFMHLLQGPALVTGVLEPIGNTAIRESMEQMISVIAGGARIGLVFFLLVMVYSLSVQCFRLFKTRKDA